MANHARYLTGPLGKQMRPKIVEFHHLTVIQDWQPILQNITLRIFEGEAVALLGAANAGKSALLACIQGQFQPVKGEISVLGASLPPLPPEIRRQIGVMPQQIDLHTHETVAAYLRRFAAYQAVQLSAEQVETYCAQYHLSPSTLVAHLTDLQARVFALALALVHDPRLVLLDEPLAGLPEQDTPAFWTYLQRTLREGRTLIAAFTSPLAEKYFNGYDVIVRLEQGHLLREKE
jgi:ABC-type multidrug transport system ATPase subunit